jgi:hypothetical protein
MTLLTSKSLLALGGIVSRSRPIISAWLRTQVTSSHSPFFKIILDPSLPSQHAYVLLRMCILPRLNYFSRIFPPDVLAPAAKAFDKLLLETLCSKVNLPALDGVAREQLSLPTTIGGWITVDSTGLSF